MDDLDIMNDTSDNQDEIIDEYSLLHYFQNQPAIAIAFVSGFIAIVSFILNLAGYIKIQVYFNFWNLNISEVQITGVQIYNYIWNVFFTSIVFIYQQCIFSVFSEYFNSKELMFLYRFFTKDCKKQLIKLKWDKKTKKTFNSLRRKGVKDIKDLCKFKIYSFLALKIFFSLFLFVMFVIVSTISLRIYNKLPNLLYELLAASLVCIIITMSMLSLAYICTHIYFCKKVRSIKQDDKSLDNFSFVLLEKKMDEFLNETTQRKFIIQNEKNIRNIFSNESIISAVLSMSIIILISFFFICFQGNYSINQKNFPIVNIEKQQYIVLYQNDDTFYLEKAIIKEPNSLEVYKNEQRIIKCSDIQYQVMTFDAVVVSDS